MPTTVAVDRDTAIAWYRRNRERSEAIFDLIAPDAYYSRPISLRNPIVFYEGHLPAFSVIAFLRRGLNRPPVDARFEALFARGIDPESVDQAVPRSGAATAWPSRDEVRAFARACDDAILEALADSAELPVEGLYTALEHEAMHQETLLYMWHRLPYEQKRRPPSRSALRRDVAPISAPSASALRRDVAPISAPSASALRRDVAPIGAPSASALRRDVAPSSAPSASALRRDARRLDAPGRAQSVIIPAGSAVLGADRAEVAFGWDNEFDAHDVRVPAFEIDALPVTNAGYLEFMNDRGYSRRELWSDEGWEWIQQDRVWHPAFWVAAQESGGATSRAPVAPRASSFAPHDFEWRGMFERVALPLDWPVYVSQAEAAAYARWQGRRLMTEPEFHRAAYPEGGHSQFSAEGGQSQLSERADDNCDCPPSGRNCECPPSGHFDFAGFDPVPVGSFEPNALGIYDLIGNGWEWTSTIFGPFPGFTPMASYPEYSADFFDGRHYVIKGASSATARELVRPSFRNWFRANYPYVYAKFRTVGR